MQRFLPSFLLLLVWLCITQVYGQMVVFAPIDTTTIHHLDEVEFIQPRKQRSAVLLQVMDSKSLTLLNTQSVADAIRFFSGVQLKDFGGVGGIKTINIRSMGTQQMGVFYDGIQLGNAQNGQIDLGRFSIDNLQEIQLYNGHKTEILQSAKDYGAAGTIYLTTKHPEFSQGKTKLTATMKAGSFGLANPALLWQQKWTDSIATSVSAEYTYATGRYHFRNYKTAPDGTVLYDTTLVRENADINAVRAEAAVFGKLYKGSWKAQIYNYYSNRGLPGYVARNVYEHHQRQWDDNFFVQASYNQQVLSFYQLMVKAKYAFDYTRYLNPDTVTRYIDNTYRQQETYVSVANAFTVFRWWKLGLSADFQWNYLDSDVQGFVFPTRYTGYVSAVTDFNWNYVKLQASVLGTFVHEQVEKGVASAPRHVFTPAVVLSVRPMLDKVFDIRAFYKRAFRMPTFNDLYYTFIGNASLQPEMADQVDLGVTYRYQRPAQVVESIGIQADAYYNFVTNKIVSVPAANPFRWQMMNLGKVQIIGADVTFDMGFRFDDNWSMGVKGTYTYTQAKDLSNPNSPYYGGQIAYTPWHSASALLQLGYKGWHLNYSFLYTGERYEQSANIPVNYVEPWYTHDLSIGTTFSHKQMDYFISVDINNLSNQQYEVVRNYPMPGLNGKVTLKITFNK
jgi:outer membrane cobalamin receptor